MPRHEAMVRAGEIGPTLFRQEFAINTGVAQHHFKPLLELFANDLAVLQVRVFGKGQSIRQRPCVTLPRDGAKLVRHSQAFFV